MMVYASLKLNDEQTEALIWELDRIIRSDPYYLGPRIRILKEILAQLKPEAYGLVQNMWSPERARPG
jgi:hypothetical protein